MNWLNVDAFLSGNDSTHGSQSQNSSQLQPKKPQPRWGQACVSAHNKIYIIGGYEGQYLGDVWSFDFNSLNFTELKLEGENIQTLSRSNHTAVFYPTHNSYYLYFHITLFFRIYVFGGGQAQKQRFNDTLKLDLSQTLLNNNQRELRLSKVVYKQNSQVPVARTYHASCLMRNYMIIIGGEATSDLKDFWALDLDTMQWYNADVSGFDNYTAKRFHTASAISATKMITFGGCHSEYVHMNEMHIFDLTQFLLNPSVALGSITCTKVLVNEGVPSTRWGHSAAVYKEKLYILGGRNEQDIIDLHEFDAEELKWRSIDIQGPLPKARRRHSCLFVSGSLIMFGGFDGNFYNDMNILDFTKPSKQIIQIQPSTIDQDYASLVNNQENADLCFVLNNSTQSKIYANKALVLFRTIEKEMQVDLTEETTFYQMVQDRRVPDFLVSVYYSKKGDTITLTEIHCKNSFFKFLEYIYCDKFIDSMTTTQVRGVSEVTKSLNLNNITNQLKRKIDGAKIRIQQQIVAELQAKQPNEIIQLNRVQQKQVKQKVEQLESSLRLDFTQFDDFQIQSPEDKFDRQHQRAASLMNQCKNLDEFYDIVFMVDDTLIKANSLVLMVRCPYFKSMLSTKYGFKELGMRQSGQIKVQGVPKAYFQNIIQYVYSDHFYIQKHEAEFFIRLLIYADYFMLHRLVDICSSYLKSFVNVKTVLKILLVAHAHNAEQLENYCITYITQNEQEVMESRSWRSLKRQAQESLLQFFLKKIREEKEESFVQICIWKFMNASRNTIDTSYSNTSSISSQNGRTKNNSTTRDQSNRHIRSLSKDEELDLDEIFNTANYIYLEDHYKNETYDFTIVNSVNLLQVHKMHESSLQVTRKGKEEEEKEPLYLSSSEEFIDFDDKENVSLLNNLSSYSSNAIQPINSIPISTKNKFMTNKKVLLLSKKRDSKRQPLCTLENENIIAGSSIDQSQINNQRQPSKRGQDFMNDSSNSNVERVQQQATSSNFTQQNQQNCNIFQAR